jgi:NADP-dependent 3-hydroxy acid dehydrogenase YdfG
MIDQHQRSFVMQHSPILKKQESGHFINLSSAAGVKVFSPEEQFTAVLNLQLVLSLKAYVTK